MALLRLLLLLPPLLASFPPCLPFRGLGRFNTFTASTSDSDNYYLTTTPLWLNQKLDHYNPQNAVQFRQRYYEFLDNFDAHKGPIFLIIGGEGSCYGIENNYMTDLSKNFNAALVTLEHRYYGESHPFTEFTTKNLQYLTSKQALFDLALFRRYYQNQVNKKYKLSDTVENPWIVFGTSYAGALSAWFRLKFPHLVHGSLADSGVVHAIENYAAYDAQVEETVGPVCSRALWTVKSLVEEGLEKNATYIKSMFDASQLDNDADFWSLLADAAAVVAQFGIQDTMCSKIVKALTSGNNVLDAYVDHVKTVFYRQFGGSAYDYNRQALKNSTSIGPLTEGRLWFYQTCTEFGFFQTPSSNNSFRSTLLSTKYSLDLCEYVFGRGISPTVDLTNLYYGGNGIAGSNIYFANGSQDPWRHASKQVTSIGEPSFVIKCQNCAHGVALYGCLPVQSQGNARLCKPETEVNEARQQITKYIAMWIREDYQ